MAAGMRFGEFATKRLAFSLAAAVAMILATSQSTFASIERGDIIYLDRPATGFGGAEGGGLFEIYRQNLSGDWEVVGRTACLEVNESIRLGINHQYVVGDVSSSAVAGGTNYGSDPIDVQTDWLWDNYISGTLGNFVAGFEQNDLWHNALQRAIWVLEGERWGFGSSSYADEAEALFDAAHDNATTASGDVFALNLFDDSILNNSRAMRALEEFDGDNYDWKIWKKIKKYRAQDQLWHVNDPPFSQDSVPEPASVLIWSGLGVAAIGFQRYRRRLKKQAA